MKPLLACEANLEKIQYPVLASPKLDGIRCIIHPQLGPVTRKLKPIPNVGLREQLAELPPCLDGELVCGNPSAADAMQRTTSAVMGRSADFSKVTYYVFDEFSDPAEVFHERLGQATYLVNLSPKIAQPLLHWMVQTPEGLAATEELLVGDGYEGVMLRDPDGVYKFGRSTVREGILLKVKRFTDMEGTVLSLVERMHNVNELQRDELGHAKRSTAKDGKVPAGTLGALQLKIEGWASDTIDVGTGFTDEERLDIWMRPEHYVGRTCTFKYQASGSKDAPRFPVFKSWRKD
jgi:DNA ligase-1